MLCMYELKVEYIVTCKLYYNLFLSPNHYYVCCFGDDVLYCRFRFRKESQNMLLELNVMKMYFVTVALLLNE
jgi:hypothetical protein